MPSINDIAGTAEKVLVALIEARGLEDWTGSVNASFGIAREFHRAAADLAAIYGDDRLPSPMPVLITDYVKHAISLIPPVEYASEP
jgi:hypothetical protein